jgi:lauroyl/myristoyl acyltransferase
MAVPWIGYSLSEMAKAVLFLAALMPFAWLGGRVEGRTWRQPGRVHHALDRRLDHAFPAIAKTHEPAILHPIPAHAGAVRILLRLPGRVRRFSVDGSPGDYIDKSE